MAHLKIQLETNGGIYEIGKHKIEYIHDLHESFSNPDEINYGITPSTGDICVIDSDKSLYALIKSNGILPTQTKGRIFLNDKIVRNFILSDINYSSSDYKVNLYTTDNLYLYDSKKVSKLRLGEQKSLYEIFFSMLMENGFSSSEIDDIISSNIIYPIDNMKGTVKQYLQRISVPFPFINECSLRELFDKFCTIAQLNGCVDSEGKLKLFSSRPVFDSVLSSSVIQIEKKHLYKLPKEKVVLKNKYTDVKKEYNKTEEVRDSIYIQKNIQTLKQAFYDPMVEKVSTFNSDFPVLEEKSYHVGTDDDRIFYYAYMPFEYKINGLINIDKPNFTAHSSSSKVRESGRQMQIQGKEFNYPSPTDKEVCRIFSNVGSQGEFQSLCANHDSSITSETIDNAKEIIIGISQKHITSDIINGFIRIPYKLTNFLDGDVVAGVSIRNYRTEYITTLDVTIEYSSISHETVVEGDGLSLYNSNELLQDGTSVFGNKLYDVISNSISQDYYHGVETRTFTVFCSDYFNSEGLCLKHWGLGDIIEPSDIISFKEEDGKFWLVTGSRLVYEGAPYIEITAINVLPVNAVEVPGLFNLSGDIIYSWDELVDGGYITLDNAKTGIKEAQVDKLDGYLYIKNNITSIWYNAFSGPDTSDGASVIKGVYIPESVTTIGEQAFYGNRQMVSVDLPNKLFTGEDSVVGDSIFLNCSSLSEVKIPNGTKVIPKGLFRQCRSINVTIPKSVIEVGEESFYGCSMKDLTIPDGVEILRNSCFGGVSCLSVFIPKSVTTAEEKIFWGVGYDYITGRHNLKIYCESESKPSGWSSLWNQANTSINPSAGTETPIMHTDVYWGYSRERYLEETKNT